MMMTTYGYKLILSLIGILGCLSVFAQPRFARQPLNRWSIEVQTGWNMPFSPGIHPGDSTGQRSPFKDYNRYGSWKAGVRYMIIPQVGMRPYYSYNQFGSSENGQLRLHNYGLDLILSLSDFFSPGFLGRPRRFNVLLHGGAGYTVGYTSKDKQSLDRIIHGQFGGAFQYRLTDRLALVGDLSTQLNWARNFRYDGQSWAPEPGQTLPKMRTAIFLTPSIGFQLYLGGERQHADWR